jgi:hypothetical protein
MLYFSDNAVQEAADQLKWTGSQPSTTDHDYLMIADAIVNADKSSSSVYRQITYDVRIETDDEVQSTLSVFYDFPSSLAEQDPAVALERYGAIKDYDSLTQVFTPAGSQFTSGSMDSPIRVVEQGNYSIIVGFVNVLYDDSSLIQLGYSNAYSIESIGPYKRYRLLAQKQPGTRADAANVTVYLPAGAHVLSVSPEPNAQYNLGRPVLEFNLLLRQDEWIEVIYD